jgi:sugar lactone lactonase YvrE
VFAQGADHRGLRFSDTLDAYGLVRAKPGARVLAVNDSEDRTYTGVVQADGSITDLAPLADRGGESAARAADGRVFVANGQILVYAADGKPAGRIDVPARPLQLLFGGKHGATLYVLSHHALYAVEP